MSQKICEYCLGRGFRQKRREVAKEAKAMRLAAGWTLRRLANRMKVCAPYLSHLERGRRNWSWKIFSHYLRLKPKKTNSHE